jgi:acyl phosphate:glycerol-3-phosphate acyltransferase
MPWVGLILSALAGYLLGSANSSIIVGKLLHGKDVREAGSGNAGATNTLRVFGKKAAILVLAGDILKGVLACLAGSLIGRYMAGHGISELFGSMFVAGFAAVLGHNWPLYFGFRGGKGVLTSAAVLMVFAPFPALCCLAFFAASVFIWKTVSLGSILAALSFPLFALLFHEPAQLLIVGSLMAVLIVARHHGNIRRILSGKEPKITDRKKNESAKS